MSNFIRTSSLVLVFVCAAACAGLAQEKKQPKKKKEEPEVIASIIKLPAEYNAASWKKFESAAGGFSILFPGTPQEETEKLKVGEYEDVMRSLHLNEMALYIVIYQDKPMPGADTPEAAQDLLDQSVKQAFELFEGEQIEQKEITLDGHPGRFVTQRLPDASIMRLKFYSINRRHYQLMVTTPPEQGATDDQRRFYEATANKFLDSFTLAPARGASVIGPVGPVGPVTHGGVQGAPVSRPKDWPRAQVSGGVLNGKAISKPAPAYPAAAVKERVEGVVSVAVVVDEEGKVMAAQGVGGHELLREAAVAAALKSRFPVTRLSGQPVKVSGIVTYNFVLR